MTELIHFSKTDLSDFSKEAYGFRFRSYKEWWTKDELEAEYAHLSSICDENIAIETEREERALVDFEALIQETIALGASDRETAIRWLVDGEDLEMTEQDLQYFFWGHGLSYEIQNKWSKELCNA